MPDRLSAFDSSLLHLESSTTPMHVGTVATFARPESGFDYDSLVDLVERRLSLIPRYRQRLQQIPGRLSRPVWIDDENFDITYHVRRSALPAPGSQVQLDELVARLQSRLLDRSRPLWELYLVEGLADGGIAVITKTHNAMIDSDDAFEICRAILDDSARPQAEADVLWMPRPVPGTARLLLDVVRETVQAPAQIADNAKDAFADVASSLTAIADAVSAAASAATALLHPVRSSPLNVGVSAQRRFAVARTELSNYRAIRNHYACTVNDVVLAVIAAALRTWLLSRGESVGRDRSLRAMVPLSVSDPDTGHTITPHLVDLPVGEPSAIVRLQHVRHQLRAHVESGRSVAADALVRGGGPGAPTLHALGARAVSVVSRHMFDLTITNVPGPQQPLYAAGARLDAMFPVVPLSGHQALSIGVSSYDGGVHFGLNADRLVLGDVDNLGRMLEEALAELGETVTA